MGTVLFQALRLRQLTDDVYTLLREKIVAGELTPRQRLAVDEISSQLGVSRTPVKDALAKLAGEDLIVIQPRRGTFVTQLSAQDILESFEIREALETKACDLLAGKIDAVRIKQLRDLNDRLTAAGVTLAENIQLGALLHASLVEWAGNRRLLEHYVLLNANLQVARIHYQSDAWVTRLAETGKEHAMFLDALAANRFRQARELLRKHIRASMKRFLSNVSLSWQPWPPVYPVTAARSLLSAPAPT